MLRFLYLVPNEIMVAATIDIPTALKCEGCQQILPCLAGQIQGNHIFCTTEMPCGGLTLLSPAFGTNVMSLERST